MTSIKSNIQTVVTLIARLRRFALEPPWINCGNEIGKVKAMTKFAISKEGIESLEQLRFKLMQSVIEINDAVTALFESIESVGDSLGVFEKDLLECVKGTIGAVNQSREPISHLVATSIPQRILDIEELMALTGEGDFGGGEDGDSPPRKKLVLKR